MLVEEFVTKFLKLLYANIVNSQYSSKYHGSAIGNFWSRYVAKDGGLAVVITDSPKYRTGKICKTYSCPHRMTAAGCFVNK